MAVTGSGTQADPFIVHSYQELKSICDNLTTKQEGANYVNLANDIDCNDYGDSFEWETLKLSEYGRAGSMVWRYYIVFDMCGHTIKNVLVKANNRLFTHEINAVGDGVKIRNGKILNIFNNGIDHLIYSSTGDCPIVIENVSLSVNGNGITNVVFRSARFNRCSIYFTRSTRCPNNIFMVWESGVVINNCDIYLDCAFLGKLIFECASGNGYINISNSRFRGKCNFDASISNNLLASRLSSCVIDMELTNTSGIYAWYLSSDNSTGVVNSSKIHTEPTYYTPGMIRVTDAELHSAASLQAKGFNVVKVGG